MNLHHFDETTLIKCRTHIEKYQTVDRKLETCVKMRGKGRQRDTDRFVGGGEAFDDHPFALLHD